MMKQLVLATFLASTATFAYAQSTAPVPKDTSAPPQVASAERTVSTGDFDKNGNISGNALLGTKVKNSNNETVGSIDDVYIDKDGSIKMVIVSVGGFLGVGSKAVAVKWSDVEYGKDNDSLKLTTNLTKDQLKGMTDFTASERRKPAPATETSSAPAMKR